jgi:hypothetical protein
MIAYRLEVVPVQKDTLQRFDNFQINYWAQDKSGERIGYRQRILDALHGVRDFAGKRALKRCGPFVQGTAAEAECDSAIDALKIKSLTHIGNQADATLCSVVRDINVLRKAAYSSAFGYADDKSGPALTGARATIWRMLGERADLGSVCARKLEKTPITYEFWSGVTNGSVDRPRCGCIPAGLR